MNTLFKYYNKYVKYKIIESFLILINLYIYYIIL